MKKNLYPLIMALICLVFSTTLTKAQVESGNQPVGDLLYAPDGYIYGVYTKTTVPGYRPTNLFRYLPGESTVDPVYRNDTHVFNVQVVDSAGYIYGTAWNSIASKVYRIKTDGSGFAFLRISENSGLHYGLVIIDDKLYGLRAAGGTYGHGIFFRMNKDGSDYAVLYNFHSETERLDDLIVFHWDIENNGNDNTPIEFWGPSLTGGTYGKGAINRISLDGSEVYLRGEFDGQGGVNNPSGPLDGEGPNSIVQDFSGPDVWAATRTGGTYNHGGLYQFGLDGNSKLHDFTSTYGEPFGSLSVGPDGGLIGLGGDFGNNTGFIYSYKGSVSIVSTFNGSSLVNDITSVVLGPDSVIYGASRADDPDNGSFFAINRDGTDLHIIFEFVDGYSRVIDPADNKTEVSVTPPIVAYYGLNGVTTSVSNFRIEISETPDFSGTVLVLNDADGFTKVDPPALKYSTLYYTRVKTSLIDDFGVVTKFTTHAPEKYSFVSSPVNGATNVATNNLQVTANIVYGATLYIIELNTASDFTGTSIVKTSAVPNQRTITFTGLSTSTTYYTRTKTNLPSDWGPVRSFTTTATPPPAEMLAEESSSLMVYPNPFNSEFTAEAQNIGDEKGDIVILDLTGRQLYRGEIQNSEAKQLGSGLPQGMYILQFKTRKNNSTHRLTKN